VLEENTEAVIDYRKHGEDGAVNYLIGQVLQKTGGSVSPAEAHESVTNALDGVDAPEWPIEVAVYHKHDEVALLEKLANTVRDQTVLPVEETGIPDRVTVPSVAITYRIHESGDVDVVEVDHD
jgi:hypothetical protein